MIVSTISITEIQGYIMNSASFDITGTLAKEHNSVLNQQNLAFEEQHPQKRNGMKIENHGNVKLIRCMNLDTAREAATDEAANTSGQILSGVLFQQGTRFSMSSAMPMAMIVNKLEVNAASKGQTLQEIGSATNRPTMSDHVDTISRYLKNNHQEEYILPPMTLNVPDEVIVFSGSPAGHISAGYIVIPSTVLLQVTDGSHRTKAICDAFRKMDDDDRREFAKDAVAVMITFESELSRIHQDFADCSRSKALPPSLVAAFDRRNPANGLVLDLIENSPLLIDKTDSTSKTLGPKSTSIFLVNHIRQYVKEMLVGNWAEASEKFDHRAANMLVRRGTPDYNNQLNKIVEVTNTMFGLIAPFDRLIKIPRGPEQMNIPKIRDEGWVSMSSVGLVIMGRMGHIIIRDNLLDNPEVINRIQQIDWRKSAVMWQDNVFSDGKILTSRAPVQKAMKRVLNFIGIGHDDLTNFDISEMKAA